MFVCATRHPFNRHRNWMGFCIDKKKKILQAITLTYAGHIFQLCLLLLIAGCYYYHCCSLCVQLSHSAIYVLSWMSAKRIICFNLLFSMSSAIFSFFSLTLVCVCSRIMLLSVFWLNKWMVCGAMGRFLVDSD